MKRYHKLFNISLAAISAIHTAYLFSKRLFSA